MTMISEPAAEAENSANLADNPPAKKWLLLENPLMLGFPGIGHQQNNLRFLFSLSFVLKRTLVVPPIGLDFIHNFYVVPERDPLSYWDLAQSFLITSDDKRHPLDFITAEDFANEKPTSHFLITKETKIDAASLAEMDKAPLVVLKISEQNTPLIQQLPNFQPLIENCRIVFKAAAKLRHYANIIINRYIGDNFYALHVRRGDTLRFREVRRATKIPAILKKLGTIMKTGDKLFIMSDEQRADYFNPLYRYYRVFRLVDFEAEVEGLAELDNYHRYVLEVHIASLATKRIGTRQTKNIKLFAYLIPGGHRQWLDLTLTITHRGKRFLAKYPDMYDVVANIIRQINRRAYRRFFEITRTNPRRGYGYQSFDQYCCIFVHIPKTAGLSVCHSLFGNLGMGHKKLFECQRDFSRRDFARYFKFTFVRNPWDRLFSAYHFLKQGGINSGDAQFAEKINIWDDDFEHFVMQFLNRPEIISHIHFQPQHQFLWMPGKPIGVDFLGFFENLATDFETIKNHLGVDVELPHTNRTLLSTKQNYQDAYTDKMRAEVERIYARDIELLGYRFDNSSLAEQIKKRDDAYSDYRR